MSDTIVEDAFETYEKEVIPESAGTVQRYECEQAFFGGASIVLVCLLDAADVDESEEKSAHRVAALIAKLRRDLDGFAKAKGKNESSSNDA